MPWQLSLSRALLRRAMRDVQGTGGGSWIVEVPGGDGISAPATPADGATITGYLYQERAPSASQGVRTTAPGTPAADPPWHFVVISGTVAAGQVLRSAADGRRVRLLAPVDDRLYPIYHTEQL